MYNISIFIKKVIYHELIKQQNATILSSDVEKTGILRSYLAIMLSKGKLEKVDTGVYVATDSVEDEMYDARQVC